ncbi:hypothetical protein [Anaerostipes sp.]|uniref:hypothetical protein n=1 Tax=Anaerostipes sp. TaxID=1872530 RepID=UPI003FEE8D34
MNRIEEEYREMLSRIKPEESFEQELLETLKQAQIQKKKPKTKVGRKLFIRHIHQAATAMAACMCVVIIGIKTPAAATFRGFYERFCISVSQTYEKNVKADEIPINKQVNIGNKGKIYLNDAVMTSEGISIRYEVKDKGNYDDVYPSEVIIATEDGDREVLEQENYIPVSDQKNNTKYYGTFQKHTAEIQKFIGKETSCTLVFLGEKGGEVQEEKIKIKFMPRSMYKVKTVASNDDWVYNKKENISYRIKNITLNAWYMKVEYEWKSQEDQDFLSFELSDEYKKQYLSLGETADINKENRKIGTVFFERTDDDTRKMIFKPVWLKESKNGTQMEKKIDGQGITTTKGE